MNTSNNFTGSRYVAYFVLDNLGNRFGGIYGEFRMLSEATNEAKMLRLARPDRGPFMVFRRTIETVQETFTPNKEVTL